MRWRPASGSLEVLRNDLTAAELVIGEPAADGLGRKTTVRKRADEDPPVDQHSSRFAEDVDRTDEVVDGHATRDAVEAAIVERQRRIDVEIVHHATCRHRIRFQLTRVHAEHDELVGSGAEVRHPRRHDVQYAPGEAELVVDVSDGCDRAIVDVRDEAIEHVELVVG